MIQQALGSENCMLFNLKTSKHIDLSAFDRIIIGGSIHAGNIQNKIKEFCKNNQDLLLEKPLGLFLSCMEEDKAQEQFDNAYPEPLRKHASSCKLTGGEFNFDRMNFIEKMLIRKISGINDSVSKINNDKIQELVAEMSD